MLTMNVVCYIFLSLLSLHSKLPSRGPVIPFEAICTGELIILASSTTQRLITITMLATATGSIVIKFASIVTGIASAVVGKITLGVFSITP